LYLPSPLVGTGAAGFGLALSNVTTTKISLPHYHLSMKPDTASESLWVFKHEVNITSEACFMIMQQLNLSYNLVLIC
jgi:hypothetical protein